MTESTLRATEHERQYLHGFARFLAADHAGSPPLKARASLFDQGVLARYWFNWRPIGITVPLLEYVSACDFKKPRPPVRVHRNHLCDRERWTSALLSQGWLDQGVDGWFAEYARRNGTLLGFAGELDTDEQRSAVAWLRLEERDQRPLFANTPSGFVWQKPETDWLKAAWHSMKADEGHYVVRGVPPNLA